MHAQQALPGASEANDDPHRAQERAADEGGISFGNGVMTLPENTQKVSRRRN